MPNKPIDDAAEAVSELSDALEQDLEHIDRAELALPEPELLADYQQPWERQKGEPESQYAWFCHFRDQGLGRTIKATITEFGVHEVSCYRASSQHGWKRRALLWDEEQERQYQLARSEAIRDMVIRHEDRIEQAIDGLMAPISALNKAINDDPDFIDNLSKTDAKKLISMSNQAAKTIPSLMQAERLARGMPTEIVGGTIDHQHVVAIERDHIGEILAVLDGAGVLNAGGGGLGAGEIVDAEVVDVHPVPADDHEHE